MVQPLLRFFGVVWHASMQSLIVNRAIKYYVIDHKTKKIRVKIRSMDCHDGLTGLTFERLSLP